MKTKVTIKTVGEEFQVDIDPSQTVAELKTNINQLKGYSTDTQELIYSGNSLTDDQVFGTIGFNDKDFLVLLVKPKAAPFIVTPTTTGQLEVESSSQTDVLPSGPSLKGKEVIRHKKQTIDEAVQSKVPIENRPQWIGPSAQTVSQPQPPTTSTSSLSVWNADAEERGAIQRLMNLGFREDQVIEAYQVSNKDEQVASNYLLDRDVEGEATGEQGSVVQNPEVTVTGEDVRALMRMEALGFDREKAVEAYLLCNRNEEQAINCLMANPNGIGNSGFTVQREAPGQVPNNATSQSTVPKFSLTLEDGRALMSIEQLGFTREKALEAYLICGKNEEHAINYLIENADELDGSGLAALVSNESDQVPSPNHATSQFSSHAPAPTVSKSSKENSLSVEEDPATPNVTSSFSSNPTATAAIANESPYKTLAEVLFLGDLSPRKIFESENGDAIQKKMDDLRAGKSDSVLDEGGLRNKALEELWEKSDKNLWQSKVDSLAKNVDANQEQFPTSMLHALQDLCSRERLGTTLMSFTWAFRDLKTDRIKGGQLFTGYDAYKKELVTAKDAQPNGHEAELEAWLDHAGAVLPRKPRTFVYQIPLNEDGVPILPPIDASEATASQLAQLLDDYLFSLWKFACGGDENIHEIPWEKVIENPHQYFDTSLYKLPYALNAPEVLKSKPHHIFALHDFFLSASLPFQFRSKDAITKCLTSGGEDELDVGQAAGRVNPEHASKN